MIIELRQQWCFKKIKQLLLLSVAISLLVNFLSFCFKSGTERGENPTLQAVKNSSAVNHKGRNKHGGIRSGCRGLLQIADPVLLPDGSKQDPLFPPDAFSHEVRRRGAVVLHVVGMVYMFCALAITCDEFFVPSLEVIIDRLNLEEDVAGATFMAAGGSAPELFTSLIGVFISFDDVGVGTIVGSAVFNILFVIGVCAFLSNRVLHLTWWPLLRDCAFYVFGIAVLIVFFSDNQIHVWEAAVLLLIYCCYVTFMAFNRTIETFVKSHLPRVRSNKIGDSEDAAVSALQKDLQRLNKMRVTQNIILHSGSMFRQGILQLLVNTINPIDDDEGRTNADVDPKTENKAVVIKNGGISVIPNEISEKKEDELKERKKKDAEIPESSSHGIEISEEQVKPSEVQDQPFDLSWPTTWKKRATFLCLLPITLPLWATLPDSRSKRGRKCFYVTFAGSIAWIAFFSYLMVWWATVFGETVGIPPEIMGLTFLAAGTSIPDLITSVIVARKGFGDMAVSSSVGSNIFDITVGLPIPWFIYGLVNLGVPTYVQSEGIMCSIIMLFCMLLLVFITIAIFGWQMNKKLGITMFFMYFIFIAVSLLFEYKLLICPTF